MGVFIILINQKCFKKANSVLRINIVSDPNGIGLDTNPSRTINYSYTLAGNMSKRVDNGVTMSYNYDKQDRLTSESGSNANRTFTFNNTKLTRETVNTERQISNEHGATISLGKRKFTHDDNGNRVVESNAAGEAVAAYQYDPFDKLINTETANKEVSYSYRPDDLMLSKTATDGEKI